jgi:hypothetical protein
VYIWQWAASVLRIIQPYLVTDSAAQGNYFHADDAATGSNAKPIDGASNTPLDGLGRLAIVFISERQSRAST